MNTPTIRLPISRPIGYFAEAARILLALLALTFVVAFACAVAHADTGAPAPVDTLGHIAAAVRAAWHVPTSASDVGVDLLLLLVVLGWLNNTASALANSKVISESKFGPVVHKLAFNISEAANVAKAVESVVEELSKVQPTPPPPGLIAVPAEPKGAA